MTDIRLKIYSTATTWADALDHTFVGAEIKGYRIYDPVNAIGTAEFVIDNSNGQWTDDVTTYNWTGSADVVQVWRAHALDDTLISSGLVTDVRDRGNSIVISGTNMSGLLQRKIVNKQFFGEKDNSAATYTIDHIITEATYGLVPKYFPTADYGAVGTTTYVGDGAAGGFNTSTKPIRLDGISVWDALVNLSETSYGDVNSNTIDSYLFETWSSPSYTLELYMRESGEYPSSGVTSIYTDMIDHSAFNYGDIARRHYNGVIVRGEIDPNATYHKNLDDYLTNLKITLTSATHDGGDDKAYAEDSGGDFINDGVVVGMFVSNTSDGCWGKITTVSATKLTCAGGINDGTDTDFDDNDTFDQAGYLYIGASGSGAGATMGYQTTNIHTGTQALDLIRTDSTKDVMYVVDGWGTNVDSRYHRLRFWAMASHAEDSADSLGFDVVLSVKDKYGNENKGGLDLGEASATANYMNRRCFINGIASSGSINDSKYEFFDIPLPKPNDSKGWDEGDDVFHTSGDRLRNWNHIYQVGFYLQNGAGEDISNMVVDDLHFVGAVPYEGSDYDGALTSSSARLREIVLSDKSLKSNTDCDTAAAQFMKEVNRKQNSGSVTLRGVHRSFALKPGNVVNVYYPMRTIADTDVPIQSITYTPNRQTLEVGRRLSNTDIFNQTIRRLRGTNQIQ